MNQNFENWKKGAAVVAGALVASKYAIIPILKRDSLPEDYEAGKIGVMLSNGGPVALAVGTSAIVSFPINTII